eukprot:TRINITY_DN10984_c0_g1_i1.p1 TRINITY_DN10984_c0_g1~~TRINITY_DN10984_c0_g1_i1.p1  ORF type:complete len:682 (+),score=150.86 TRINITY_DN10984_c0_g1_i1:253-2298(+)
MVTSVHESCRLTFLAKPRGLSSQSVDLAVPPRWRRYLTRFIKLVISYCNNDMIRSLILVATIGSLFIGLNAVLDAPLGDPFVPSFFFDPVPITTLRAAPKKVFSVYMFSFPLSLDNKNETDDYYTRNYLNQFATGLESKWNHVGSFIRSRPWPRTAINAKNYKDFDFANEVRRAKSLGIDGFMLDVFGAGDVGINRSISVIQQVDPTFKVVLMPDFADKSASPNTMRNNPNQIKDLIRRWKDSPVLYRTPDNNGILVTPFIPNNVSWWIAAKAELAREGINISVVPIPLSYGSSDFAPWGNSLHGFSSWGGRTPTSALGQVANGNLVHSKNLKWMAPVAPQDFRPKSGVFTEANCSATIRYSWESAINANAEYVNLITWNDYSEHSVFSPSSGVNDSIYDLTAYYNQWYKTGVKPEIKREAIYYFHRLQRTDSVVVEPTNQNVTFKPAQGTPAGVNFVELLAFLRAPATLEITIGGKNYTQSVGQGMQSLYAPLAFSSPPEFRVLRNNAQVLYLKSSRSVSQEVHRSDYLYYSGKVFGPRAQSGLRGTYYNGTAFNKLATTRVDATVNFNWTTHAPLTGVAVDNFSVRWTGFVQPKVSGTYTFYTTTDDGARLWVDNTLLVDKWTSQSAAEWSGSISLTAGQSYPIKFEYYDGTGKAVAQLEWSSSSVAKAVVPTDALWTF